MQKKVLFFLIILMLCAPARAAAQSTHPPLSPGVHVRFEQLTIDDGLSQNAGLAMLQDSQGYLWIGTQDGLDRYDGHHVTVFKHDPQNPNSISSNSISSLYEDAAGFLWVGAWGGGLNRYDPATEKFTQYVPDPSRPDSLINPTVTQVLDDGQGGLWVATLGGLERFDPAKGTFTLLQGEPAFDSPAISALLPAEDGKLWVGTGGWNTPGAGLFRFDPLTGKVEHLAAAGDCLKGSNIADILPDAAGNLWIAYGGYGVSGGGIDRYNPKSGACTHFGASQTGGQQITEDNFTDLLFDRDGGLWAASWSAGLWYVSPQQPDHWVNLRHQAADPESISSDDTFRLLFDRGGVLWISTLGAGINKVQLNTLQFRTYKQDASQPLGLPNNHVGSFAETRGGEMWVGTLGSGLTSFDAEQGTFRAYRADAKNPQSLSNDMVMSLFADADGTLWVGTLGGGLNHFDPATGLFTRYQNEAANPASLLEDEVTIILRDAAGRLWAGNFAGLSRLDPGAKGFVNYPLPAPVASLGIRGNELWVGTWGAGVLRLDLSQPASLDPATAVFSSLVNEPGNANSLSENGVLSLLIGSDGTVWLGTQYGLNRYRPAEGSFKLYTEKEGLHNNTILSIAEDSAGMLWLTTNNGLARVDPLTETITVYDKSNGLQGNEFNSNGAFLRPSTGEIYVGGVSGFSVFHPLHLSKNEVPPQVKITDFSIFNISQPRELLRNPIPLTYKQNFISFEFAALDYSAPSKNIYAYQLQGFDKDWILAGTRNYASYTNLPGGDYVFRVKAANSDGVWNEEGVKLPLSVTPPLWLMWQFQVAAFLCLAALVGAGFQWRIRSVRQQNVRLEGMLHEQKRAEAELRESEARFRSIFDNAAVGVALMSLDRHITQVNQVAAQITGYSPEELTTMDPAMLALEEDRYQDRELAVDLMAGKREQYTVEKRYLRKNGEMFWGRVTFSAVRGPDGLPMYVIGMLEDITEERLAAERLAAQETEYRRLLEQRILQRTEELNLANERLREKAAQDAVIAERTRLARDLHDAVTQTLFSTTLIADVLPDIWEMNPQEGKRRLQEVRQLTRGALAEMRTLLVELRPNALVEVPLPTLLRQLTEALTGRARIHIQLNAEGERKLPVDVQIAFYRIAQEALNNVVKHARATEAVVTLRMGPLVRLTVADDGAGFDPALVTADHLGLKIMRERAEAAGARFVVESEPGEGTQISVVWQEKAKE